VRVPQSALYEDDTVYVVANERLSGRKVDVIGADGSFVLLRGNLAGGDAILTSRLLQAGEGVKVRIIP
ncbi:MAG: efflux transporter periplasmic adaptor subunit, partial [Hyphomicrobiales bacterium]|nr:efflux transporter periplasmic adaptor subunit [Hyphomicrobiales bacterium]